MQARVFFLLLWFVELSNYLFIFTNFWVLETTALSLEVLHHGLEVLPAQCLQTGFSPNGSY
jgi:hypothetical protein